MKTLLALLSHASFAGLLMRHNMVRHSLITIFADTSEGGSLDVILTEDGSAVLQEDSSYITVE